MAEGNYNQFCPIAMASEILCTRWTLLVLRELLAGSTRFNELRC
jgi:DNA-binding HxlR family transcriptional regulator